MSERSVRKLAVIGAGNMGAGIAQKIATEGFEVVLVDLDDDRVAHGLDSVRKTLDEGVERKIFRQEQAKAILGRLSGTADWGRLADVDLVIEAVFEDLGVKKDVFGKLEQACKPETILATNTSSFLVSDVAEATSSPGRVIGLHYFYHPAKNRLVEVVPGKETDPATTAAAWALQEQIGKTPIASADASGFVVNRYFVPWLNEAVRLLEEGVADIPTIEQAAKKTFGVGMGPFELMNVTGVPIALHAATTLGEAFGPFYVPADTLRRQVDSGELWNLEGTPDPEKLEPVAERMRAATFYVAGALVDEGVGTIEDTDIGARVGLRWPRGPFEMINRYGVDKAATVVEDLGKRWGFEIPRILETHARSIKPFAFRVVKTTIADGIATLTVNRPDAMNALNVDVVSQLGEAFAAVAEDPEVTGIVISGAGKAFIAGADIRFFVRKIDEKAIPDIVDFTTSGHALLNAIDACPKPVVARLDGLALGGGLELALACDYIIATPKAVMAFPETGIGIYPGLGGTQRTQRRIGAPLTRWMVFTGQMVGAKDAEQIGLVDRVVPHGELDGAIRAAMEAGPNPVRDPAGPTGGFAGIARFFEENSAESLLRGAVDPGDNKNLAKAVKRVGTKAPIALEIAERLIAEGEKVSLEEGLQRELDHIVEIFSTSDAYEGLSSLGKKAPVFKGS
ncbi:MAG: 3-hydroxyacyl-CoA dehydrogenase NAD-binding domain-containing protein [Acidobacteriota bacterium]|nr:3-hydroxyacyl-CoA dehydrogenase NAD-binding domain-containing protein [Acidobacteriota bacterium]